MYDVMDSVELKKRLYMFAQERDWNGFYNPQHIAMAWVLMQQS